MQAQELQASVALPVVVSSHPASINLLSKLAKEPVLNLNLIIKLSSRDTELLMYYTKSVYILQTFGLTNERTFLQHKFCIYYAQTTTLLT